MTNIKHLGLCFAAAFLASCTHGVQPERSNLETPKYTNDGTAIAFNFSAPGCFDGTFLMTPILADGKYGKDRGLMFTTDLLGLKIGANSTKNGLIDLGDTPGRLFAKKIPPGRYFASRPVCKTLSHSKHTDRDVLMSFFEFEVEPGKTNYIGKIQIVSTRGLLYMRAGAQGNASQEEFQERYGEKDIGPLVINLATETVEVIAGEVSSDTKS